MTDMYTEDGLSGGDSGPLLWLRDADYRSFFYNLDVAVILSVPHGRILAASPAACRLLAMSETELCAAGRSDLADPDDLRWAVAMAERDLTGRVTTTLGMRRGDGEIIEVHQTASVYLNEDGVERSLITLTEATREVDAPTQRTYHLSGHVQLTNAELRILGLLPTHYSIGEIAQMLFNAHNTVKTHLANIYRKLGVHNRSSAVARAHALGILRFPVE